MSAARLGAIAVVVGALVACGGGESAPKPVEAPAAPEAAALGELDPSKLSAEAEKKYALVPSPVETQGALTAAGIDTQLAALVPADRGFNLAAADGDRVAVRTGVVVADMLLTTKSSSNDSGPMACRLCKVVDASRSGISSASPSALMPWGWMPLRTR